MVRKVSAWLYLEWIINSTQLKSFDDKFPITRDLLTDEENENENTINKNFPNLFSCWYDYVKLISSVI